jgi:hypothetical protein
LSYFLVSRQLIVDSVFSSLLINDYFCHKYFLSGQRFQIFRQLFISTATTPPFTAATPLLLLLPFRYMLPEVFVFAFDCFAMLMLDRRCLIFSQP